MDNFYGRGDPQGTPEDIYAWRLFEARLGAYLSTMIDPRDEDRLTLYLPNVHNDGQTYALTICSQQSGSALEIQYGFDEVYCDPDDLGDMPWRIGDTIRARFDLRHPQLISVSASGPAAIGLPILGLADHDLIERETHETALALKEGEPLVYPEDQDTLVWLLLSHLREKYDPEIELDADGDIRLERDGATAWVQISDIAPVISLIAGVVANVRSRRQADIELNVLNRVNPWCRWSRHRRDVWQRATIPVSPFNPQIFDELVDDFFARYAENAPDLADRLCATTELELS